jgi:hypothetical protein
MAMTTNEKEASKWERMLRRSLRFSGYDLVRTGSKATSATAIYQVVTHHHGGPDAVQLWFLNLYAPVTLAEAEAQMSRIHLIARLGDTMQDLEELHRDLQFRHGMSEAAIAEFAAEVHQRFKGDLAAL